MIRSETSDGWILITHPDHARLAGQIADVWGNDEFVAPEPFAHVREAVYCHDDGWITRDFAPTITREGKPSAFSSELVGKYAAFEEIDLADYLAVRGRALDAVAARDPFAAVVVSLHTANLLSEQADLSTLRPADRPLHAAFLEDQRLARTRLAEGLKTHATLHAFTAEPIFDRAFRFLQCCDSFSLIACAGYDRPRPLRHSQLTRDHRLVEITCTPLGGGTYTLEPWPLREPVVTFQIPTRIVKGRRFANPAEFDCAWRTAEFVPHTVRVKAKA